MDPSALLARRLFFKIFQDLPQPRHPGAAAQLEWLPVLDLLANGLVDAAQSAFERLPFDRVGLLPSEALLAMRRFSTAQVVNHCEAMLAVACNVAVFLETRDALVGVPPLIALIRRAEKPAPHEAATHALWRLAADPDNQLAIAREGYAPRRPRERTRSAACCRVRAVRAPCIRCHRPHAACDSPRTRRVHVRRRRRRC